MADVAEQTSFKDAATAISQGKRHLLVQDYTAAVTALAEGLEMMSQKLGDCNDELGEPYLLYGRALLGLAREEAGVFGEGVPGSEDVDEDDEDDEEEDKEENEEESEEKEEKGETEDKEKSEDKESSEDKEKSEEKEKSENKDQTPDTSKPEKSSDEKMETNESAKDTESVPGTSKDVSNGVAGPSKSVEEGEDVTKEEDGEDPGRNLDLQVAWEVLELAKIVFKRRGENGKKQLAETQRLLGEVAMESDNPQGAIIDLQGALELMEQIEPFEPRALADIHYQLGLAHSLANDFDASIKQFGEATNLLETRIKQLQEMTEKPASRADDPFYSIEGEIKELQELLPAIREKIADMRDCKEEACRMVIEGIKNKVASTNGSTDGASTSSQACAKPASDISHLVRKKRKHEDGEEPGQSPCKKIP